MSEYIRNEEEMDFKHKNKICGFELREESFENELQSTVRVFKHSKSGARLVHISNDDNNKVFSICFRTPCYDNKGIPHILEHVVLSGSKKFRTKEPYRDMIKGSLQTYINAITFSDNTLYSIASKNRESFFHLMDVYLDAVFNPRIYENPYIFSTEAWRYELTNENYNLSYKGIVYNEMRGAVSSPEKLLKTEIKKSLFPDTNYKYSSGGIPERILEVTYEEILNYHSEFYHPSNSFICIYGNGDLEEQLRFIDREYLSNFSKRKINSLINIQKPFSHLLESKAYYSISKNENDADRTYLSMNFVLGETSNPEIYFMEKILKQLLIKMPRSSIKQALISEGIGEVILYFNAGGRQISFCIIAKNTSSKKKELFKSTILTSLKQLVAKGIDKRDIEACINNIEYGIREFALSPNRGVVYNMKILNSWLYDSNPLKHVLIEKTLSDLRLKIKTNYYEEFIIKHIINNNHSSIIILNPKKGLLEEKNKDLDSKLKNFKNRLTKEQIDALVKKTIDFKNWQSKGSSIEEKATIPTINLAEVNKKIEIIEQEVIKHKDTTVLYHDIFTNNIAYIDFLFDISMVSSELISYVSLLTYILGRVDVKQMNYFELGNILQLSSLEINLTTNIYEDSQSYDSYYPKFIIKGKVLGNKIDTYMKVISQLIVESDLSDKKRIKELIVQVKSKLEMSFFTKGHLIVAQRVSSYYSQFGKYNEKTNGFDFYWFICRIIENFERDSDLIIDNLMKVYKVIFNTQNLIISFTGEKKDFRIFKELINSVTSDVNQKCYKSKKYNFKQEKGNEAMIITTDTQYIAKGFSYQKLGYQYHGSMRVLREIINEDYLHNRIRLKGNAYGCGINFIKNSRSVILYSFRDPNLKKTLETFNECGKYIRNLKLQEEQLNPYIIGAINRMNPARSPYKESEMSVRNFISNVSSYELNKEIDEVLNANPKDLINLSNLLEEAMMENYCCIIGNKHKIEQNQECFRKQIILK